MGLNRSELLIGFAVGMAFWFKLGLIAIPLAILTSVLWALSGMKGHSKLWRRIGVPLVICLVTFAKFKDWTCWFSLPMAFVVLSLGYGIPDAFDEGSMLGRFWYWISPDYAELFTRVTIYLLLALSFIPCFIA